MPERNGTKTNMDQDTRESAERLQAILESAVDGIISIDERGIVESINASTIKVFGYEREEVLGSNVRMLMPPPFSTEHDGYLSTYLETGEAKIIGIGREVVGRRKDGTEFPMYLAVSEGTHRGQKIFTGIVRDLSELRRAEDRAKAAEQLASLSVITAGIAHDIGTPMNVILGYAEMLRDSLGDAKNRRRAEVIAEQVRRVTDLLSTLLNIARPRHTIRTSVAISDILDHSLDFFHEKMAKRKIEVERRFVSTPDLVGDRDRLEQLFLNLIVNAADAMKEGGKLSVVTEFEEDSGSGGWVTIRFSDTGHGMDGETRSRIFEPFYSTKDPGKGTGLGLVVAKTIVTDHDGTIECDSEIGKGTHFSIRLPTQSAVRLSEADRERRVD